MLTREQALVFNEVIAANESTCIIHGKAGVGKSILRDEFLSFIESSICLGPTGISIENSRYPQKTMTIAKFLKIRPSIPSAIIIDEMSMVSLDVDLLLPYS